MHCNRDTGEAVKVGAFRVLAVIVAIASATLAARHAQDDDQIIRYHGIRASDPDGKEGLRNPERGFRYETRIAESDDQAWAARADREDDGRLTLVQCYCYLPEFIGKDISAEKLDQLQASFDMLRGHGMKAALRFAYESEAGEHDGPTLADIRRHISQLRPLLVKNVGVIHVLQAGMIGLWGEWHHSVHGLDADADAQKSRNGKRRRSPLTRRKPSISRSTTATSKTNRAGRSPGTYSTTCATTSAIGSNCNKLACRA